MKPGETRCSETYFPGIRQTYSACSQLKAEFSKWLFPDGIKYSKFQQDFCKKNLMIYHFKLQCNFFTFLNCAIFWKIFRFSNNSNDEIFKNFQILGFSRISML